MAHHSHGGGNAHVEPLSWRCGAVSGRAAASRCPPVAAARCRKGVCRGPSASSLRSRDLACRDAAGSLGAAGDSVGGGAAVRTAARTPLHPPPPPYPTRSTGGGGNRKPTPPRAAVKAGKGWGLPGVRRTKELKKKRKTARKKSVQRPTRHALNVKYRQMDPNKLSSTRIVPTTTPQKTSFCSASGQRGRLRTISGVN
ncbi:hypothetical protein NDU88_006787 [Pleurodeles waltl]|uniref:Uncharacterized protein n=1 Tax=Pleurodeles waltl TaxID=8319 RepID=A0AAV7TY12_PLEWA|nr:hypothetical protein NDU88_006787 [Pleurodeles waltl]